jgi:hypothetical protein
VLNLVCQAWGVLPPECDEPPVRRPNNGSLVVSATSCQAPSARAVGVDEADPEPAGYVGDRADWAIGSHVRSREGRCDAEPSNERDGVPRSAHAGNHPRAPGSQAGSAS